MRRTSQRHRLDLFRAVALFFLLAPTGCSQSPFSSDPCEQLCNDVTIAIRRCRESWGVDWQDLGAKKQSGFLSECVQEWKADKADMEPRELDLAHSQCEDAQAEIKKLGCDELRALYL